MPPIEAGSFSQRHPSSIEKPSRAPSSHKPLGQSRSQTHAMPPLFLLSRDNYAVPQDSEPTRPTTAEMYRSHTASVPRSTRGLGAFANVTQASHPSATPVVHHTPALPPGTAQVPSSDYEYLRSTNHSSPPPTTPHVRPISSATSALPDASQSEMLPEREPPFKRPGSRLSGSERSLSRPTSALDLPPLPKPKVVGDVSWSAAKLNLPGPTIPPMQAGLPSQANRSSSASPHKRSFDVFSDTSTAVNPNAHPDVSTSQKKSGLQSTAASAEHQKLGPMDELLARNRPLVERAVNVRATRISSLVDAPHEVVSPPSGTTAHQMLPPAAREIQAIPTEADFTIQPHAAASIPDAGDEAASLTAYAAQSREDRVAALDEFMVSKLEDPSFATLCHDVENCWRRIALGL
jgi:hypothetical protein